MLLEETSSQTTEEVWKRFHADVHAFVQRRVQNEAEVEDLVQEVFLRVHRNLTSVDDDQRIAGWLFKIVRNVIIDHYRRRRPEQALEDISQDTDLDLPDNENKKIGSWLLTMIESLPDTYREAVRLAEVDELPQKQIAKQLGLSVSGAKSRVQRGREHLRKMLDRCCQIETDRRGNVVDYASRTECC